jgi:hypothetical protein
LEKPGTAWSGWELGAGDEQPDLLETIPSPRQRGEGHQYYKRTCEHQDHDGVVRLAGVNSYPKEQAQDSIYEHGQKEKLEYQNGRDNGKPDPRTA